MADLSNSTLTSVLEYLHLGLRYIASGFVAMGVYIYLYDPMVVNFRDMSWFVVFATATIGIITYALHFATLDKIFYGWSIMHFLRNNSNYLPDALQAQIQEWQQAKNNAAFERTDILKDLNAKGRIGAKARTRIKRYVLFALANQTYLRNISKNESITGIQVQVERRLALLNFLYCSFYQIMIFTVSFGIGRISLHEEIHRLDLHKMLILVFFSGLILFSAVRFNRRICSREMWLVQNFPQQVIEVTGPGNDS